MMKMMMMMRKKMEARSLKRKNMNDNKKEGGGIEGMKMLVESNSQLENAFNFQMHFLQLI